ncbi:MAG: methyltransferase [Wenzhouxiangellaceae bacterium]|nr:methyltransferase [Wenzhouxiangellaceae bacterium]
MNASRLIFAALAASLLAPVAMADERLQAVVDDPARPADEKARDPYRHPVETLTFFGIEPDMTVVEIAPGGGWYTEILAPYLAEEGRLVAAHYDVDAENAAEYWPRVVEAWRERVADEQRYGEIEFVPFAPPQTVDFGEPGSADMVLTFRNVHGWKRDGSFDEVLEAAHEVLRDGGVLGVVGHRLPADRAEPEDFTGYVHQDWVVARAESHGFRLVEASEINANPADTADHPNGVWTLPPSLNVDDESAVEKYREIGESDRFTLKFVKR